MATLDEVTRLAMELSEEERAELIARLHDDDDDEEFSPEFVAELERRWREVKDGTAELFDWEDVLEELRSKYVAADKTSG